MKIAILLLALLFGIVYTQQCVQDFECGNYPYSMCKNGVNDCKNMLPGLAADEATGTIYYAQVCKARNSKTSNITIKSVSVKGGVPAIVHSEAQAATSPHISELYDFVGGNIVLSVQSAQPGEDLRSLSTSSWELSASISAGAYLQALDYDLANKKTYTCGLYISGNSDVSKISYKIDRWDGILGQDVSPSKLTIYAFTATQACTGVKVFGDNLYYATKDVKESTKAPSYTIFQGTTAGSAITSRVLTSKHAITDFDVSADQIFYITTEGVFSANLQGGNMRTLSHGPGATGITVVGNQVVWNSGMSVIAVNVDGSALLQANKISGQCVCKPGFSGAKCNECPGGQVQWLEGSPSCVTLNSNGNPATCNFDYECANNPYSECDGRCKCRTGFSGPQCSTCAGTVTWKDNVPTCKK